jgi:hypothetical protein
MSYAVECENTLAVDSSSWPRFAENGSVRIAICKEWSLCFFSRAWRLEPGEIDIVS